MDRFGSVALIDRRELSMSECLYNLSIREEAEAASYRNTERRHRTIVSRTLLKYLLTRLDGSDFHRPCAREVMEAAANSAPDLEVLSGTAPNRRGPKFYKGDAVLDLAASSSHCGPFTACCIGPNRIAVDLERVEQRRPEFDKQSFSWEEQATISRFEALTGAPRDALTTFLWTVKEAFLKVLDRDDMTVWSFPFWTVRFDQAAEQRMRLRSGFTTLPACVRESNAAHALKIATMGVDDMILTVVRYLGAAEVCA